jgi:sigma-B regulation protein RsbU (phosphoserine phosphatase)
MACRNFSLSIKALLALPCLAALLAFASLPAIGQSFDATALRQPTELDATWLVHGGDDPSWASPSFDDSKWLPFTPSRQSLHDLYPNVPQEVVWYRLHIKVDPSQTGLALQEWFISSAFDVYSNGVKLIQVGQVAPFKPAFYRARLLVRIPDDQIRTGSIVIALRVHVAANEWANGFPGYYPSNLTIGQQGPLHEHIWLVSIGENALDWLFALISAGLCLGALLLYTSQRRQREYFWLSLLGLAQILPLPLNLYGIFHSFSPVWFAVYAISGLAIPYLLVRMYFAFVRQRIDWRFQLFLALVCISYVYANLEDNLGLMTLNQQLFWSIPRIVLVTLIVPGVLLVHWRRGNREAAILLIPALLSSIYLLFGTGALMAAQIPAIRTAAWHFYRSTERLQAGPFQIWLQTVLNILAALSLALIILLRSNRQSRQQAMFENEMAAAREVQQVILPEAVESVPGFTVESAYQPAQQVGGDFFQILPDSRGGLLLVVGDVAGKGLPAAMLVSVLVGAIRTAAAYSQSPSEVLAQLNERLVGRTHGGFSTALAAHITADGWVTIANAGHLSPYLDGKEVGLPGALPLGILGNATYETTQFHLPHGSRLTFYSDGVVEAQNQKGELFGFDRAKHLSTQTAASIVQAAVQFGQSDDITVVAICRTSAIASAA